MIVLLGLELRLRGILSFFRIPYNSLLMDTYVFPPKTTAVGMISAALGWDEEKHLSTLPRFRYGVIIEAPGETVSETAAIYKSREAPIYPITKNMNYKPSYRVFFTPDTPDDQLMQEAGKALSNPAYVLSLGDSENLWYPKDRNSVIVSEAKETEVTSVRCILPSEVYNEFCRDYSKLSDTFLPPREVRIPVGFTGSGRRRRFISTGVYYYSGIRVNLSKPLPVLDFNGEPVCLF